MKVLVRITPMWKVILMLGGCMFFLQFSFSQGAREVSGTVTDNTDETVPGVNVLVEKEKNG